MKRLVEKYRPKTLNEIIGQDHVVEALKEIAKKEEKPHMLFVGPSGVGTTTAAMAFEREIFGKYWRNKFIELNASDERGIDTVREKIKRIALTKGEKILFLDEADALTPDAQQALRRIMEKTRDTIFILSCNYEYRIIDPIKSRCARFIFKSLKKEDILKRLIYIIQQEKIVVSPNEDTKKALLLIVDYSEGDMRKAINLLEEVITSKKELSPKNVLMLLPRDVIYDAIDKALNGDFFTAKRLLEDAYISAGYDAKQLINQILKAIEKIRDDNIKIKLYDKVAELDYRITVGSNPLIQLIGFLAYVWVVRYVPDCPIMKRR